MSSEVYLLCLMALDIGEQDELVGVLDDLATAKQWLSAGEYETTFYPGSPRDGSLPYKATTNDRRVYRFVLNSVGTAPEIVEL